MRQITLSVALEVKPESADRLSSLLDALRGRRSSDPSGGEGPYAEFLTKVPALHFMSLSVFPGFDYDPLFVIEANFDGEQGPFWAQLEAAIGDDLRRFLRCCKRPLDNDGPLFDAVTAPDSRAPIAPYLQKRALTPTVFHHGNRGMTRDRILREHALFLGTRGALDAPADAVAYRKLSPAGIHTKLRAALLPEHGWLNDKAPRRIPLIEYVMDYVHMALFVIMVLFVLSLPGMVLKLGIAWKPYVALLALIFLTLALMLKHIGVALPVTSTGDRFSFLRFALRWSPWVLGFVALYWLVFGTIGTAISMPLTGQSWRAAAEAMAIWLGWGLVSLPVTLAGLVLWLRNLERGDSAQAAPPVDATMLREMARREDWIPQNHMGSIVLIKPGVLRAIIIRAGHRGLGLLLRIIARKGYLGSMRTIHFAHWALVNNQSRLMFFSNFDQTWESYLDDFIEKAHAGLTLAWSCGVGFPPTRFLVKDGASHGRQFKEWARHSMTVSRFWYSAYKNLTAEQIERNFRIANGLRKPKLSEKEAATWINDL